MRLSNQCNKLFGVIATFILCVSGAFAQDDSESQVQEFESVEDATLDGSATEAAGTESSTGNAPANEAASGVAATPDSGGEVQGSDKSNSGTLAPTSASPSTSTPPDTADTADIAKKEASTSDTPAQVEPPVPETPVVEATDKHPETPPTVAMEGDGIKGTYGGRIFGRQKIQLAANRPTFNEGQKCYDKLYGKPETHISLSGDWFPLDWWINPGITMKMGMSSVRGKAVSGATTSAQGIDCNSLTLDENSKTTLLFIPIQLGLKLQFSPFRKKWLVVDYWTSAEYGWWQETRDNTAASFSAGSLIAADRVYANTGRKSGVSSGVTAHLLLNPLDERSVRSMMDTMGIGYVYLSGFMETVKSTSQQGLTFGRNVLGIGFTFEAYK